MQNPLLYTPQHFDTYIITRDNIDTFLANVYKHYKSKGLTNIILLDLLKIISIIAITTMYTTLIHCVNYDYFDSTVSDKSIQLFHSLQNINSFTIILWILSSIFLAYQLCICIYNIYIHQNIKYIYNKYFGVSQQDLEYVEWQTIAHKLTQFITIYDDKLDELDIMSRMMRRENYIISMVNINLINLSVHGYDMFTYVNEYIIMLCIFSVNWSYNGIINTGLLPAKWDQQLRRRSYIIGIITILLFPIICIAMLFYVLIRYGEQFYTDPSSIFGSRKWSIHAQWKLRELNEMQHLFDKRLRQTHVKANEYIQQFPTNSTTVLLARFAMLLIGSLLITIIIIALLLDNFTFKICGIPVMLVITVLVTCIGCCRALLPPENITSSPKKAMMELVKYTHFYPKKWRGNEHLDFVLNMFNEIYTLKVKSWIYECVSIFLLPYTCFVLLPRNFNNIVSFFRTHTVENSKIGNICVFSLLTEQKYFGKRIMNYEYDKIYVPKCLRQKNNKMEKSFVNFFIHYPEWQVPSDGEKILEFLKRHTYDTQMNRNISSNIFTADYLAESLLSSLTSYRKREDITTKQREEFYDDLQYKFYGKEQCSV